MGNHGGGPSTGAHRATGYGRIPLLPAVLGGVVLLVLGAVVGMLIGRGTGGTGLAAPAAAVAPATAAPDDTGPPTMLGQVVRVDSGDEVVVRVGARDHVVAILGISAPRAAGPQRTTSECGAVAALRFADRALAGQTVTLVPDPTIPATDDQGRRLAYVVLASQLNFTDSALLAGVVTTDASRPLRYAPVFDREQAQAVSAGRGLWGSPCNATPGRALPAGT